MLLIVTHGGPGIGGGHASRCLALAEAFSSLGFPVVLAANRWAVEFFQSNWDSNQPLQVLELRDPLDAAVGDLVPRMWDLRPTLTVADSYLLDCRELDALRGLGRLFVIDDLRTLPVDLHAHGVLNYSLTAHELGYVRGRLLLGPRYALLRRIFWRLEPRGGERILVIPGASDPLGVNLELLRWDLPFPLDLVVGPMVPRDLVEELTALSKGARNVRVLVSPPDLPDRMASCGTVLCTSSVTAYEALALGKRIVTFQVADNQASNGRAIGEMGLGIDLGPWGSWGRGELIWAVERAFPPPPGAVDPRGALNAAEEMARWAVEG
ncbi:PseG/SpsG family protein [Thermanaerovibrio acidaminovorans]|uniref:PseG/SpsG family protein n=1 Tax=Thermanaerovibrio acidaminovorans TaxID=81462 RepID=UPI0024917811|nr:hypothetical protein [Thermanaerovibrio acidaminovorans]